MVLSDRVALIRKSLESASVVERSSWILIGVILIALNLRLAIGSVLPVLETIRTDLGLGHAAVSFLVTIPVVCMGVFALVAAPLSNRFGRGRVIQWAVLLVGLATAARLWGAHTLVLFGSTILVGIGIAISQTLLPSVVSEFFPNRAATVTGLYTACLIAGLLACSLLASGVSLTSAPEPLSAAGFGLALSGMLSIVLTSWGMIATDTIHASACATTLIVSLGLLSTPVQVGIIVASVVIHFVASI